MMSRASSNSWKHLGVGGGDGVLQALPFRAWIGRSDSREMSLECGPMDGKDIFKVEWHTLNLDNGEISETLSTMPPEAPDSGTAVACRNRVYVLGGLCARMPRCLDKECRYFHPVNCVFYFDYASPDCEWKKGLPMLFPRDSPSAVATRGKIYVFGSISPCNGVHFAEVFDPNLNCWDKLPAPPVASGLDPQSVSDPVLFDSSRSRILVHFNSNDSLHAFRPDDGSWECLDTDFGVWTCSSLIVGDIAYFLFDVGGTEHHDSILSFCAYHLIYKKWFPVKWSTGDSLIAASFPDLLHLGKNIMCLVEYSGQFLYLKFRVRFESGEFHADADPTSMTTAEFESSYCLVSML